MIHLDARHKLTQELIALHDALAIPGALQGVSRKTSI
jgi:hypothetical protein